MHLEALRVLLRGSQSSCKVHEMAGIGHESASEGRESVGGSEA